MLCIMLCDKWKRSRRLMVKLGESKKQRHYYEWEQKDLDKRSFATWVDKLQFIDTAEWPTCPQPPRISQIFYEASVLTVQFFNHISAGFFFTAFEKDISKKISAGFIQLNRQTGQQKTM